MRDFGITIITILAIVGLCAILGFATRGTEHDEKDKNDAFLTMMRGFGTLLLIFGGLSAIGAIIYVLTLPFH